MKKRIKTLVYKVIVAKGDEKETILSTYNYGEATEKFYDTVMEFVKDSVLGKYTEKEITFGVFNGTEYIYPNELADSIANKVYVRIMQSGNKYFVGNKPENGEPQTEIYILTLHCIEEVDE